MSQINDLLYRYADRYLFRDADNWTNHNRPYHRQLRPQALRAVDLDRPLTRDALVNYESLAVQRVLTSVYEHDLVFLPRARYENWYTDFKAFYSPEVRSLSASLRAPLEAYCYGFLDSVVEVSSGWSREAMVEYFRSEFDPDKAGADTRPRWFDAILNSADPERAAKTWLIQFAPDFLSESSPMIRNVLGSFGPTQSEWFKMIIDEYGYGVHETKHSTLFEDTLASVGLASEVHHYWQYYLATSLSLNNYFHYLGANHDKLFQYIGALVYTETTLVEFCKHADELLKTVFGELCDTRYFTEHIHIDVHHGRMAFEKLCMPLAAELGEDIIPDVIRGVEEYKFLTEQFEEQFSRQISWMDNQNAYSKLHDDIFDAVVGDENVPVVHLDEPFNELSNTHCHNTDELCHVFEGEMQFVSGFGSELILKPGDGVVIRNRCQHGADIKSENCKYAIYSIGDGGSWAG